MQHKVALGAAQCKPLPTRWGPKARSSQLPKPGPPSDTAFPEEKYSKDKKSSETSEPQTSLRARAEFGTYFMRGLEFY